MTIEIVDFPIKNGGSFHSYVKLPEGRLLWIPKFMYIWDIWAKNIALPESS